MVRGKWQIGATWQRWDPHIHTPSTVLNNSFVGGWEPYLTEIEQAEPRPVALGITDYATLRSYDEFKEWQLKGRAKDILAFPNVEFRLTVQTATKQSVNAHLLIAPDADMKRVRLALAKLTGGEVDGEKVYCEDESLQRFGRAYHAREHGRGAAAGLPPAKALELGVQQFKVEWKELVALRDDSSWSKQNFLIALSAGNDGLQGLKNDSSFKALEIRWISDSDIILGSAESVRNYYSRLLQNDNLRIQAKPCLHGSDAHKIEQVLAPALQRYCWIKSTASFAGLLQTLHEPLRRVSIGRTPPEPPAPSKLIRSIRFEGADWLADVKQDLALNSGLVTVIGPRGSGKTAFLDFLAIATGAPNVESNPDSFLGKAGKLAAGLGISVTWESGDTSLAKLPVVAKVDDWGDPVSGGDSVRVKYLSQQFVGQLCNDQNGLLVEEIEQVVFRATPFPAQRGCEKFRDLRDVAIAEVVAQRAAASEQIMRCANAIVTEHAQHRQLPTLLVATEESRQKVARIELDLQLDAAAAPQLDEKKRETAERFEKSSEALLQLRTVMQDTQKARAQVVALRTELERLSRHVELTVQQLRDRYGALLSNEIWGRVHPKTEGPVADSIAPSLELFDKKLADLTSVGEPASKETWFDDRPHGYQALERIVADLQKEMGAEAERSVKRRAMVTALAAAKQTLLDNEARLEHAQGAQRRMQTQQIARASYYKQLCQSYQDEVQELNELYAPLKRTIEDDQRLKKFSVVVSCNVDVARWLKRGSELVDMRRVDLDNDTKTLQASWQSNDVEQISEAMQQYVSGAGKDLPKQLKDSASIEELGVWLYSTEHFLVHYAINYDGVPLEKLSPGTKGVVLLTLYLGLDRWDDRPLLIDQPEENLDPRSVFEDLVPFFREAASRRQVIMVTHNANLVVNTDSDQVVVAESVRVNSRALPRLSYRAGGLEDERTRQDVCAILEGGEQAFLTRARRYLLKTTV